MALRVAEALGYLEAEEIAPAVKLLDRVLAILWTIIDPLSGRRT